MRSDQLYVVVVVVDVVVGVGVVVVVVVGDVVVVVGVDGGGGGVGASALPIFKPEYPLSVHPSRCLRPGCSLTGVPTVCVP